MSDLINRMDAIEKLEYFCMVKALEDQNHPSAEARTQMSSADLISRQDVLDYIDTMPSELTSDGRRMVRRILLTEYIADTLPSAQRKGKWILHQDSRTWECSECHKYQVIHSDYCMHCGAKMEGSE